MVKIGPVDPEIIVLKLTKINASKIDSPVGKFAKQAITANINDKNCSSSTELSATYQKLQKNHKNDIIQHHVDIRPRDDG